MSQLLPYKALYITALAVMLASFLTGAAMAEDKSWASGTHGLNEHATSDLFPDAEFVDGRISEVTSSGIYMDGEYFPLVGAEIIDDQFRPVKIKELYIGLRVQVFKRFGSVAKLLCFDMTRSSNSVPTNSGRTGSDNKHSGSKNK